MNVVGHQTVSRAQQPFPRGGVEQQLTESAVKGGIQPAGGPVKYRQGPVNRGVAPIKFRVQAGKMTRMFSRGRRKESRP